MTEGKADRMIEIRCYPFASKDFDAAVALRTKVLREPLGLVYDPNDLAKERDQVHFGAFDSDSRQILGTLILAQVDSNRWKMRQVAVDPKAQGSGVGTQLVLFAERFLRAKGEGEIELHARATAIPFYERLGYRCVGGGFIEVGLAHRKMVKVLQHHHS